MNGDGNQQRYVSTFKMYLKPRHGSQGDGPGGTRTRGPGGTRTAGPGGARTPGPGGTRTPGPGGARTPGPGRARTPGQSNGLDRVTEKVSDGPSPLRGQDPPLFTELVEDCSVDEGSDITLRGVVTGSQPIRVSWLYNGEPLRFGKPFFDGREVRLVVVDSLPEDAGAFTCLAENQRGRAYCCAAVLVRDFETLRGAQNNDLANTRLHKAAMENGGAAARAPLAPTDDTTGPVTSTTPDSQSPVGSPREVIPKRRATSGTAPALRFEDPPQHVKVRVGDTARLTCPFSSGSPVVSCWIRDKAQVADSSELWTESSELSSTLVIAVAEPRHAGRYTVVVRDRKSSAEHSLALSVIEPPEPPSSCPVVSPASPSSSSSSGLVLSWSGPCYDGGSVVLGYVVEVRSADDTGASWTELTARCQNTSYGVSASGLLLLPGPGSDHRFRVRAYNEAGVSAPSRESEPVVRMEREEAPKEACPQTHTDVTIDSAHKITDHYNVGKKLGAGKFGQVFQLTHRGTGDVCAGKFYKGRRAKEREAAWKEVELMKLLHHSKLVQCLAVYDTKPEMVMVMEFLAGGELFERIVDDDFEHTEPTSVGYMQQILEGINYVHRQCIVHLDLKPENIVCVDHTGTSVKIIDFGLASKLDPKTPLTVMQGTPEFVAPEVINYEPIGLSTDMWSIGVICYLLLSGESPFQGDSDMETLARVTAAQWDFDEESFEEITEQAKDFISSLLNKDLRRRMTSEEALAHSWMAAFDSGELCATKSLSKEKMKKYLVRQKWKKAGRALMAIKKMALLSKGDRSGSTSSGSPTSPADDCPLSPESLHALQSLELKMQEAPHFSQSLEDQTVPRGAIARLSCLLTGYPDPEVVWLCGEEPVEESPRVQMEYEEDGRCALVVTPVTPGDANVYTCRATNDQGEALCSARLTVTE